MKYVLPSLLAAVGGGLGLYLFATLSEWREGEQIVSPSVRGLVALTIYGAFVGLLSGIGCSYFVRSERPRTPAWLTAVIALAVGCVAGIAALPFTIPQEVFDFLVER